MEKEIRIGILTWTQFYNYGTILQAYGLYNAIKMMGYDTCVIDYKPSAAVKLKNQIRYLNPLSLYAKKIRRTLYNILYRSNLHESEKKRKIRDFLETGVDLTYSTSSKAGLREISKDFSIIICGSDQIWTPISFSPEYYLDFIQTDKKKIAYAPSFGINKLPKAKARYIKKLIEDFDSVSVREIQGVEIIKGLCGFVPKLVADPVFLLSYDHWYKIADKTHQQRKYVFSYILENNNAVVNAMEYSKLNGLDLLVINESMTKIDSTQCRIINDASPEQFLGLILGSEKVFTDSYHGFLFSLIFRKPVKIIRRFNDKSKRSQNSRIDSLLKIIDMPYEKCCGEITSYDYEKIAYKLDVFAERSRMWLKKSIE